MNRIKDYKRVRECEFFGELTKYRGGNKEPLNETCSVLSYEAGRVLEHAMYYKWGNEDECRRGFLKSELMDVIAQSYLICGSLGVDFVDMLDSGLEKALERWHGEEVKR